MSGGKNCLCVKLLHWGLSFVHPWPTQGITTATCFTAGIHIKRALAPVNRDYQGHRNTQCQGL